MKLKSKGGIFLGLCCSHIGLMNELLAKLKNEGFLAEDLMHGHQHSTEVILVPIVK